MYEPELMALDPAQDTLDQKFMAFHRKHPEVFQEIFGEASFRRRRGDLSISMKGIFESLRLGLPGLNNSYTRHYTDLVIERDPTFAPYFQRRRRAARDAFGTPVNIQHSFDFCDRVDYRAHFFPKWTPKVGMFAMVDNLTAQLSGCSEGCRRYAYGELVRLDKMMPDGRWVAQAARGGVFLLRDFEVWPNRLIHYLVIRAGNDIVIDMRFKKVVARFPPLP